MFWGALIALFLISSCREEQLEVITLNSKAESYLSTNLDSVIYYAKLSIQDDLGDEKKYYSHFLLGYAYYLKKDFSKATTHYLISNELIPSDDKYNSNRASISKNLGAIAHTFLSFDHAIDFYNKALLHVSDKEKPGILYNLALSHKKNENSDKAIELMERSSKLANTFRQNLRIVKSDLQIGVIESTQGNILDAENHLYSVIDQEASLKTTKYSGRAYHVLANNRMESKEYDLAIEFFGKALSKFLNDSDLFITYMDMGDCYLRMGKLEKAKIFLSKAESLYSSVKPDPDYSEVFNLLAKTYKMQKQYEQAMISSEKYGMELNIFLQEKQEIINLLNKQRFEELITSRASLKELIMQLLTYRNISVVASIGVIFFIFFLIYRHYRSLKLKKQIANEINSI